VSAEGGDPAGPHVRARARMRQSNRDEMPASIHSFTKK
jgi:hypothetical protein